MGRGGHVRVFIKPVLDARDRGFPYGSPDARGGRFQR